MLLEGIFVDVQSEFLIEILEENPADIIPLTDNDGILLAQLVEVGEGGTEHRV